MANVAATETSAPVAGGAAGEWDMPDQVKGNTQGNISNNTGVTVYIRFYSSAEERTAKGAASATIHDLALPNTGNVWGNFTDGGITHVKVVSIAVDAGGDVSKLIVAGGN